MQADDEIFADWVNWRCGAPLHESMTFANAGLLLGRGTLLAAFGKYARGAASDPINGNEARIVALLTGTFGRPLAGGVIAKMRRACAIWLGGDKGLAQIHLALTGLPRVGEWDAYCLHLADKSLARGVTPSELMKAIGFPNVARELEKYSANQPRVPAGSGRESGRGTSGGGGSGSGGGDDAGKKPERAPGVPEGASGSGGADSAGRATFVHRVDIRVVGATRPDANPDGIVPGAQYAQANPAPVILPDDMKHIHDLHFAGTPDEFKGKFTPEYSNEEAIRGLVEDAWKNATQEDLGAGTCFGTVVIGAGVSILVDGAPQPYIIGYSGKGLRVPAVPTNTYVVVLDENNYVKTCYPINPADEINFRDE